jgi:ribose transport system substrate-binding protein
MLCSQPGHGRKWLNVSTTRSCSVPLRIPYIVAAAHLPLTASRRERAIAKSVIVLFERVLRSIRDEDWEGRSMKRAWCLPTVGSVIVSCLCAVVGCNRSVANSGGDAGGSVQGQICGGLPPLAQKTSYTVGFIQVYEPTNPYTIANTNDMIAEARKRGYKLVYEPATTADSAEQEARVQALVAAKVDAIIMRPIATLGPSVVAARKACIPVFTEGRFLDPALAAAGTDYVTHMGTDSTIQGQLIADWLIKTVHGKATIIELEGTAGSSPAVGRKKGFDAQIATQPGMTIVASQSGNFDRTAGHDVVKKLLSQYPTANVVYAHNDQMALGTVTAVKELGKAPGKDVVIVSIDGLREAVQHVIDGTIAAIEFNDPKLGAISFETMEKYAGQQVVPPKIIVKGPIIDRTNAAAMIEEAF